MSTRMINPTMHGAVETLAAPAIMVAPFALGFARPTIAVAVVFGALLMTIALQLVGGGRALPLSAHAGADYALALFAIGGGLAIGLITGAWLEATFLVGIGAAQVALTAATRFSASRVV